MDFQRRILDTMAHGLWNFVVTCLWSDSGGDVVEFEHRYIKNSGPECYTVDSDGDTSLNQKHFHLPVEYLQGQRVFVAGLNLQGEDALDYVIENGWPDIQNLLRDLA